MRTGTIRSQPNSDEMNRKNELTAMTKINNNMDRAQSLNCDTTESTCVENHLAFEILELSARNFRA